MLVGFTLILFIASSHQLCYNDDSHGPKFFGSKTTYTTVYDLLKAKGQVIEKLPDGAEPVLFYLIARHAIRHPKSTQIVNINDKMPKIKQMALEAYNDSRSSMYLNETFLLSNWQPRFVPEDDYHLTESGIRETIQLAKRFKSLFGKLLDPDTADIDVTVSARIRTTETAEAFFQGLNVTPKLTVNRELSEFAAVCKEKLADHGVSLVDPTVVKNVEEGKVIKRILGKVSQRLGLEKQLQLNDFKILFRSCAFEMAAFDHSPWCAFLDKDDLLAMEHLADLETHYDDGYGRYINHKMSCPLIQNLLESIDDAMKRKDDEKPRTYLRFSHAGSVTKLAPVFGLFDSLTCSNDDINNVGWRTSLITPFGANFAFILYKFPKDGVHEYKFQVLVQEAPMLIDGCESTLCPVEQFLNHYKSYRKCSLNDVCRI
ncbi:Multiple inositol polyphosphate phosphatase 1 [Halotydeus destructor]|nr:Multiple inositol polyphosphate phosphatase 1 [Halotydeus destructor]